MGNKLSHILQRILTHQISLTFIISIRLADNTGVALEIFLHWAILVTIFAGFIQIKLHEIITVWFDLRLISIVIVCRLLLLLHTRWITNLVFAIFLAWWNILALLDLRASCSMEGLGFYFRWSLIQILGQVFNILSLIWTVVFFRYFSY